MKRITLVVFATVVLLFGLSRVGVLAQTATPPTLGSEVSVDAGNGFGSTGTHAMTFANVDANVGTAITYSSDAVNGDSFTINADGLYSISYTDGDAAAVGDIMGISLNGSASTGLAYLAAGSRVAVTNMYPGCVSNVGVSLVLAKNDVIRAHRHLATAGTATNSIARFIIVKVG